MQYLVTAGLGTSNGQYFGFVYFQRVLLFKNEFPKKKNQKTKKNEFPAFSLAAGDGSLEAAKGKAERVIRECAP